jgi:CRP-like cAMP-binding protein
LAEELAFGDVALRESVSRLPLFADLERRQVEALLPVLREVTFGEGEWVLRRGKSGVGLYIVLDGEAGVLLVDEELTTLTRGAFFGEISSLLGEETSADVLARTPLRCLFVPAEEVQQFLLANPWVMYRMLQAQARRIREKDEIQL